MDVVSGFPMDMREGGRDCSAWWRAEVMAEVVRVGGRDGREVLCSAS